MCVIHDWKMKEADEEIVLVCNTCGKHIYGKYVDVYNDYHKVGERVKWYHSVHGVDYKYYGFVSWADVFQHMPLFLVSCSTVLLILLFFIVVIYTRG